MGTNTPTLDLYKPAGPELVNVVTDLNNNSDKIDAYALSATNSLTSLLGIVGGVQTDLLATNAVVNSLVAQENNRPHVEAVGNPQTNITNNVEQRVTWLTFDDSSHNFFADAAGVITFSGAAGWYNISSGAQIANSGTTPVTQLTIKHNSGNLAYSKMNPSNIGGHCVNVTTYLNPGDIIELYTYSTNVEASSIADTNDSFIKIVAL